MSWEKNLWTVLIVLLLPMFVAITNNGFGQASNNTNITGLSNQDKIINFLSKDLEIEEKQSEQLAKLVGKESGLDPALLVAAIGSGGGSAVVTAFLGYYYNVRQKEKENEMAYNNSLRNERIKNYSVLYRNLQRFTPYEKSSPSKKEIDGIKSAIEKWYYEENGALYLGKESREKYYTFVDKLGKIEANLTTDQFEDLKKDVKEWQDKLLDDIAFKK
jgi:hypothetical protein